MTKFNLFKTVFTGALFLLGISVFGQGVCTQYNYYYADINYPDGAQTDIYSVSLEDGMAVLSPIVEDLEYTAHIAYNEANGLIYVVNGGNGDIRILDPITNELSEPTPVDINVGNVTVAAMSADGQLLIGSGSNGLIWEVDLETNPYELSVYADNNDISGGDITFVESGDLYLASKPEGALYNVLPGFANELLGNVNGSVTGMATFEDGESVIVSSRNNTQFLVYSVGDEVGEPTGYDAMLDGEPFTLDNGDMAAGCAERSTSIEGCEDFRTYYIHDAVGGGPDILYAVEFNEMGDALLTELAELGGGSHLGVGADGLLYIVRHGSGMMRVFNPMTLMDEQDPVQITFNGQNVTGIPAVVVGDDGFVYVGSNNDMIYKVDPSTGIAVEEGAGDVNGGDLIFAGGSLWVANRSQGRFYEINGPGQFDVAAQEINGVANLPDGNLLISNGNLNGLFEVYEPITGNATGEVFETGLELFNGDLASRCFDGQAGEDCEDFVIYLSANGGQGGDIYRVTLDGENANLEMVLEGLGDPHLAYDSNLGLLYIVGGQGNVAIYDPATGVLSTFSNIAMGDMNINSTYAAVVNSEGVLLVGSANANKVYEVDPATGAASNPIDVPVNGGDIVQTNDGNVWVIHRDQNRFYNITDGVSQFDVDELTEMYGAAVLPEGMILVGNAGTQLRVVDPSIPGVTETTYELGINITAGDLAAGCSDNNPIIVPEQGECYATEALEYIQGTRDNGGPLAANRTDANQALGEPEGTDQMVFVTLGYGGSIILGFDGYVPNLDGDDLEVVETSFNNPGCESYPEYADVYVSANGVDFFFAETVCKGDNGVDISEAGDFESILLVKLVNNEELTTTFDGYDLDGVRAIHNCVPEMSNPYCSNETVIFDESDNIIRLTAMGWYQECSGEYGRRWRIRNGSDSAIEAYYNFADDATMQGPFNLEAGEAVMFTSDFSDEAAGSRTMRVFVDGEEVQVKAHGGNVTDLADCMPEGCPDGENVAELTGSVDMYFEAFPNPTEGITNIQFNAPADVRAVVEVFDMSGRSVETIFNQDVQEGAEYRITFDGTSLPNGIYIAKFITDTETVIEKIMIAR